MTAIDQAFQRNLLQTVEHGIAGFDPDPAGKALPCPITDAAVGFL